MTHIARHFGAALICAFLWLSVSSAQAAVCNLIFEVIPSKDTAPIIGSKVTAHLASKNFADWRGFSERQAEIVDNFLQTNFDEVAEFYMPTVGIGGYKGNSSPSIIITVDFEEKSSGNELEAAISEITAAVGYTFIQDGTVAFCSKSVGEDFGSKYPLYSIAPGVGFTSGIDERFVKTAYSVIVDANDDSSPGYTFDGDVMYMLDLKFRSELESDHLREMLKVANLYLGNLFTTKISISSERKNDQPSIYLANNWVKDPTGSSLLKYVGENLYDDVLIAQKTYIEHLKEFASMN